MPKETPKLVGESTQGDNVISPESLKKKKTFATAGNLLMPPILEEREMGSSELSFSENPKNTLTVLAISEEKSKSFEKSNQIPLDTNPLSLENKDEADIMIKEENIIESVEQPEVDQIIEIPEQDEE